MKKYIVTSMLLFSFISCKDNRSSAVDFDGVWTESSGYALELIIRDKGNSNYYVSYYKTIMGGASTYHFTSNAVLSNGDLVFSDKNTFPFGFPDRISFSSGKLIFDGYTYIRKDYQDPKLYPQQNAYAPAPAEPTNPRVLNDFSAQKAQAERIEASRNQSVDTASTSTSSSFSLYYAVSDKAYFYSQPLLETKRKAFLAKGDRIQIEKIEGEFGYGMFINANGVRTSGWLLLSDLSLVE